MTIASGIKSGIAAAWALSLTAVVMFTLVTDSYRSGYEDMIRDACWLFFIGLVVALAATVAATLVRRRNSGALAGAWLGFAVMHVILSILFFGGVFALISISS